MVFYKKNNSKIVAKCKVLVTKSNRSDRIRRHTDVLNPQGFAMHYRAISNTGSHFEVFESERFTLVCFRILKHGDPVGNQRIVGLFSIISI